MNSLPKKNAENRAAKLIVMAGLPGTGKSTIAGLLEKRLGSLVLNKDRIRSELFSKEDINFTREQDDFCMEIIFLMAGYILRANPVQNIIIDGRTFSRACQIERLLSCASALNVKPTVIECICDDAVARERLEADQRNGAHPAGNRTYELYLALKEEAEPIILDHAVIDTGKEPLERSFERCMAYLQA